MSLSEKDLRQKIIKQNKIIEQKNLEIEELKLNLLLNERTIKSLVNQNKQLLQYTNSPLLPKSSELEQDNQIINSLFQIQDRLKAQVLYQNNKLQHFQ